MHYSIDQEKTLFLLQSELIDTKVEVTVSKSISQVVDQIMSLRFEMHKEMGALKNEMHSEIGGLRDKMDSEIGGLRREIHQVREEMNYRFSQMDDRFAQVDDRFSKMGDRISQVGERLSSVETAIGKRNQVRGEFRVRFIDYAFKTGWLLFGSLLTYLLVHSQFL